MDHRWQIMEKVQVDPETQCWVWTGATNATGYGFVRWGGRVAPVHRVVYEIDAGDIPAGLHIDHLCFNRKCCNPAHLEPVTVGVNNQRMHDRITECPKGHPWVQGKHGRYCQPCRNENRRRRHAERVAADPDYRERRREAGREYRAKARMG